MLQMSELLTYGAKLEELSPEIQASLKDLLVKVNKVRAAYAKPMSVSSGIRTMKEHLRIYAQKGITDQKKIPMKSKHLFGQAVDIRDPKQELQKWCKANPKVLEDAGLYMEDFSATPTWVHFQNVPPASGKRYFMP